MFLRPNPVNARASVPGVDARACAGAPVNERLAPAVAKE
jgi:hypothetical protein